MRFHFEFGPAQPQGFPPNSTGEAKNLITWSLCYGNLAGQGTLPGCVLLLSRDFRID